MLIVEYLSPDGNLIERFEMADGQTLNHAAKTICPDDGGKFPVPTIALVGAKPAVRDLGDWDFPLSDASVQFRQLAMGGGGGGSNTLQMVLQVALLAAAAIATMWVGGIGIFAEAGLGLGAAWGGLAGAAVMTLGTLMMGVLFQNKLPQGQMGAMGAEQASPTYSINASGNQARLYQVEPELFGRMKIVSDFVANTWTEFVNNDQIGYFVYAIGRGEYQIESLQFGETVFWRNGQLVSDSGYEIIDLEIVQPGNPVTIFPDNVITSTEVSGQTLFAWNEAEYTGAIGPYVTNPPGTVTNRISLDFVFQSGLGQYDEKGNLGWRNVYWEVWWRKVDDYGNALNDWSVLSAEQYGAATLTPQRITRNYNVPEGRYEVRCIRNGEASGDGQTVETLVWAAMRAMLPGTYTYPITCIAFSVRANNALTQSASRQFSAIATRKLPLYDRTTKTWSDPVPTRSWAAAVSHVCKCEWGGRLADADIDLDTLWEIDGRLQAKDWNYDSYIDGPYLVWNLLNEMCQSQLVIPRLVGPVLSFVEDAPDRTPAFALTPRNIMRNTFAINYSTWSDETPDDVTVEYLDADYGFQQRDVTAVLPESESQEPSSMDILGITDRSHAHKVAVAYAAHNRWQRVSVECQVEALGRLINRGDICTVAHPRFKNTCAGAVEWWNESALLICVKMDYAWPKSQTDGYYINESDTTTLAQILEYGVRTDKANEIAVSNAETLYTSLDVQPKNRAAVQDDVWYIAFTRQDGSIWGPCKIAEISGNKIKLDAADYSTLLLQGQGNPLEFFTAGRDRQPTTWTLYSARNYQRLMIVDSIDSQDALHYSLKLLNYDARIYQYGNLPVPIWQGRGQLPDNSFLKPPTCLKGIVEGENRIRLVWLPVIGATWYEVQYSHDNTSWTDLGRTSDTFITLPVSAGAFYVKVRAGNDSRMSAWTSASGNTLLAPPDKPEPELDGAYESASATVSWNPVERASQYAVSLVTDKGATVYTGKQEETSFEITPEIQTRGPYRWLKCEVRAMNENGTSQPGSVTMSDPALPAPQQCIITESVRMFQAVYPPPPASCTGYAIIYGDSANFGTDFISGYAVVQELPYQLDEMKHYCRIALKDAFFDAAPGYENLLQLNWSDVQQY